MQSKIYWIDNLQGITCLMVVMIYTTTWYVTNAHSVNPVAWDTASVLNSALRVNVSLFFMIPGHLFFGEYSVQPHHFLHISLCPIFYSATALLYIALFISTNMELVLKNLLQELVFYHLWFFLVIAVIYLVSPLIQVESVGGKMSLMPMVMIGITVNSNTVPQKTDGPEWLSINLYINGDTFYYILYDMSDRATGMMDTQHEVLSWVSVVSFVTEVFIIPRGILYELQWRGNFADTWYLYCGPMVFICAIALLTLAKNMSDMCIIRGLGLISRHSLGIYGFRALIIHALRTWGIELKNWPTLDIIWIFCTTLAVSLLFFMLVQRIGRNRLVSQVKARSH